MNKLNIALVTNKELHHKYWAYSLYMKNNVKLIIHPNQSLNFFKKMKLKVFKYGFIYSIFKFLSLIFNFLNSKKKQYENKYFSNYESLYKEIPSNLIYNVKSVNSNSSINLIKKNNIDIICFLGGEIARSNFIKSSNICTLNFHSGLSPFFNGNNSLLNTYRKKNLSYIGGTLMIMSPKIDHGNILSHYLTPISLKDKRYDLYMKTIKGSVKLYQHFLNKTESSKSFPKGVKQMHEFNYYKNIDWNITDDLKLNYFESTQFTSYFIRKEKSIYYYNNKENDFFPLLHKLIKSF